MTRRSGYRTCLRIFTVFLFILLGINSANGEVVVGFGDSITQGYPYIRQHGNGQRIGGYEPELERLFDQNGKAVIVLNYGVAGEITPRGVGRIDTVLDQSQPDYILILEGTNDLFSGISIPTTIFNLSVMIDKSRGRNVEPIIATLSPDLRGNIKNVEINYNPEIMNLAGQKGVFLADQYNALIGENWDSDGLHPNEFGYRLMAREWFVTLQQAMNSNR